MIFYCVDFCTVRTATYSGVHARQGGLTDESNGKRGKKKDVILQIVTACVNNTAAAAAKFEFFLFEHV